MRPFACVCPWRWLPNPAWTRNSDSGLNAIAVFKHFGVPFDSGNKRLREICATRSQPTEQPLGHRISGVWSLKISCADETLTSADEDPTPVDRGERAPKKPQTPSPNTGKSAMACPLRGQTKALSLGTCRIIVVTPSDQWTSSVRMPQHFKGPRLLSVNDRSIRDFRLGFRKVRAPGFCALRAALTVALTAFAMQDLSAPFPDPIEGDVVIRDFRFFDGQMFPELKLHYRTLGAPKRDAAGRMSNAVLVLVAWHRRERREPYDRRVCGWAFRQRANAGRCALLHHHSRQHRARPVE